MPISAISTDTGIDTAVTRVGRIEARNSRMTTTAISRPRPPSTSRLWMESEMNGAWSNTTVVLAPWPRAASSAGSRSRTSREMATLLPSGVLVTDRDRLSRPFVRASEVAGASRSVTVATWSTRTAWPVLPVIVTAATSDAEV